MSIESVDGESQLISISDILPMVHPINKHFNFHNETQLLFFQDSFLYLHDLSTNENLRLNDEPMYNYAINTHSFGVEDNHVVWENTEFPEENFSLDSRFTLNHYDAELKTTEVLFETEFGDSIYFEQIDFSGDTIALLVRKYGDNIAIKIYEVYLFDFSCPNTVETLLEQKPGFSLLNNLASDVLEVEVFVAEIKLQLVDQFGRILGTYVFSSGVQQINVSGLAPQLYFLRSEKAGVEKFVKM